MNSIDKRGFPYSNIKGLAYTYTPKRERERDRKRREERENGFLNAFQSQSALPEGSSTQSRTELGPHSSSAEGSACVQDAAPASHTPRASPVPQRLASHEEPPPHHLPGGQGQKLHVGLNACPRKPQTHYPLCQPFSLLHRDRRGK